MEKYTMHRSDFLQHHGILGMKWGVRRFQNKNGSLTSAGKKRYAGKSRKQGLKLTDHQKRAIKIGAAVAITGLAAYGGYKLYKSGVINSVPKPAGDAKFTNDSKVDSAGFKILDKPESLAESLNNANPNRVNVKANENNCTYACIAGFMRQHMQRDVIANNTGGEQQILGGVVEDCFRGARVIDGSAAKFGKSPTDAEEFLVKKFGNNAAGVCSIQWKKPTDKNGTPIKDKNGDPITLGGHAFSWEIKDGKVSFMDYKHARGDQEVRRYWSRIDVNDSFTVARLDNAEPVLEKMHKYVSNR